MTKLKLKKLVLKLWFLFPSGGQGGFIKTPFTVRAKINFKVFALNAPHWLETGTQVVKSSGGTQNLSTPR